MRKPEKEMYGKCELKWPAYMTVVCMVVVMIGGVMGIVQGVTVVQYFNDVGCKFAALGDDMLNGRISPTVTNRFFVGVSPLGVDFGTFSTGFNTIWTQNQNVTLPSYSPSTTQET